METGVWSLGWEDPLEKGMATHVSILTWRIPWTKEPGRLQSTGSQRGGHNSDSHWKLNLLGLLWWSDSVESACNAGDLGSIPGFGRSCGEGNGNSNTLAWRIPWTEEPDGLQSMELQESDRTEWLALSLSNVLMYWICQVTRPSSSSCIGSSILESPSAGPWLIARRNWNGQAVSTCTSGQWCSVHVPRSLYFCTSSAQLWTRAIWFI